MTKAWPFLFLAVLVQLIVAVFYYALQSSEAGVSLPGRIGTFLFFFGLPSALTWFAYWRIRKTRSTVLRICLFAVVAIAPPVLIYLVLAYALQGFSH